MECNLPTSIEIDGEEYKIRQECDYRIVLDTICALNDTELDKRHRIECALYIFYEDLNGCTNIQTAANEMLRIINCGECVTEDGLEAPPIMDWEHDFKNIAPPINRVLGYSVRDKARYTHWYDFIGAYGEIGDCYFAQIISIRSKKRRGKPLDENERRFYNEHKKDIDLPSRLNEDEQEWLDGDW